MNDFLSALSSASSKFAGPNIGHMSEGLIGAASIRTITSWDLGVGRSISFKDISSCPSVEIRVNSCFEIVIVDSSPSAVKGKLMS